MPKVEDGDDLDLDLEEEESTEETDESAGNSDDESAGDGDKAPKKDEDKRLSKLQSEKDKAEARANKLEKELAKLKGEGGNAEGAPKGDPERAALLEELRESGLDAVYADNPELRTYGIERDLISGSSRAEMRESATQLVTLIKAVETKVRNETLKRHGITPEPAGATRTPPKNYAEMSNEDIEKEISRVKSGGVPGLW